MVTKKREDRIPVACANCPHCGKDNVVARVSSARSGFNSTTERETTCKRCHKVFTIAEYNLQIRRKLREEVDAEYSVTALTWID
jgi:transposase-like protein